MGGSVLGLGDGAVTGARLFLDADELFELTGYRLAKYQAKELRRRGWRFECNAAGRPLVARAYFERRMVGQAAAPEPAPPPRHNFDALKARKPRRTK